MFVLSTLTTLINRLVRNKKKFASFAGACVGLRFSFFSAVWRINPTGELVLTAPYIDPDVVVEWKNNTPNIQGNAKLLQLLSEECKNRDWALLLSEMFSPTYREYVLYGIEKFRDSISEQSRCWLATPNDFEENKNNIRFLEEKIRDLQNHTVLLEKQIEKKQS